VRSVVVSIERKPAPWSMVDEGVASTNASIDN
jgi:hypothetical protein